jgi:dephospho-CoA kinase
MTKVALTGGIATGKSYVLERLKERGVPVIDADDLVHEALGAGTPATNAIASRFGSGLLKPDGSMNRKLLGVEVFRDAEVRHQVERILHPIVYDAIQRWFGSIDRPFGVASIPLLYETGREGDFDFVAVTVAPADIQLQRLRERDGVSEAGARQRIAAQLPAEEKATRGDFVIRTGNSMRDTDRQVEDLIETLRKISAQP